MDVADLWYKNFDEMDKEDPKPPKGTYVSRSAYAKLQAENRSLKRDIYMLCHEKYSYTSERLLLLMKWRKKFKDDEQFDALLREWCNHQQPGLNDLRELDNHPQL